MYDIPILICCIILIAILICMSAIFSSSEMAFISLNRAMLHDKALAGNRRAQLLLQLLKNPNDVVSAILICNNLVNIFVSVLAGTIMTDLFGSIGIGIATSVMFFLLLIFGEAAPKAFGLHNERLALKLARSLFFITKLFYPLVKALSLISNSLIKLVGGKEKRSIHVTEKEILAMMRLGESQGTIQKDEHELVKEIFEFDETPAYKVYTPREKIIGIHIQETIQSLVNLALQTGYSRYPVYDKDLDDIVGMVHIKDVLSIHDQTLPVKNIMRSIVRVNNPNMKVDDILREMRRQKTHLAFIQNLNGKTIGLLSMEDLIEEIFGEIFDEHD